MQNSGVFCARSVSAGVVTRYFSRCLIFWCFWIKPKAQKKKCTTEEIDSYFGKYPAPPIGRFLRGADLPPFVTERWRQKCPQGTSVGIGRRFSLSGHKKLRCFAHPLRALEPPSDLIPPPVQCGDYCALRAMVIIRLRPHMAGLWSSNAMGACLPDQVKTHPLFRIGCAERGAILPVRVPEVVKTIYFLKKRARLFFNSQNYSIFALDFAE